MARCGLYGHPARACQIKFRPGMRIGVRNINPALLGIAWRNDIALRITRWHAGGPQQDGDCRGKMHTVALFVFEEEVFYEIPFRQAACPG